MAETVTEQKVPTSAATHLLCSRDTNGDGDCPRCAKHGGCPFSVFTRSALNRATMTDDQAKHFKRNAVRFVYSEWLGTIKGWRAPDGQVLIEQCEPA